MSQAPFISVVVPVRNEEQALPALLQQLLQQEYPVDRFEILVADGMSTDNTRVIVQQTAKISSVRIHLIDNPGVRSSAGRNCGIRAAQGEYIVFIDGHTHLPHRTLLADTARIFSESGAACLCRPQPLIATSGNLWQQEIAAVRATALGHGRDSLIYDMRHTGFVNPASSGASYAAWVFGRIGLYDESFDACEDVELNVRVAKAKLQAYTDPRLAVFYEARSSLSKFAKQLMRYGRGRVKLARKHPDTFSMGTAAPLCVLASVFLALVPVALPARWNHAEWNHAKWLLTTPFFLYLVAVLLSTLQLARKRGAVSLRTAPAIYLCLHLSLAWGMVCEWMTWPEPTRTGSSGRLSEADRT